MHIAAMMIADQQGGRNLPGIASFTGHCGQINRLHGEQDDCVFQKSDQVRRRGVPVWPLKKARELLLQRVLRCRSWRGT